MFGRRIIIIGATLAVGLMAASFLIPWLETEEPFDEIHTHYGPVAPQAPQAPSHPHAPRGPAAPAAPQAPAAPGAP